MGVRLPPEIEKERDRLSNKGKDLRVTASEALLRRLDNLKLIDELKHQMFCEGFNKCWELPTSHPTRKPLSE